MTQIKKFSVFRFDPDTDKKHHFDEFEVPFTPGMTVLDGLNYIQENLDATLSYRSSCREGVCGSCAMHINGKYGLACEAQLTELPEKIKVRPLAHLDIIRDLYVDMDEFWRKYKSIKPYLIPGDIPPAEGERLQSQDERAHLDVIVDCILCGACYGACAVNGYDSEYLGPAALAKANRFLVDSRDHADEERLSLVAGEHGALRCHTMFNCQEVCPKEIDPTANIANLKRNLVTQQLSPKFSKKGV